MNGLISLTVLRYPPRELIGRMGRKEARAGRLAGTALASIWLPAGFCLASAAAGRVPRGRRARTNGCSLPCSCRSACRWLWPSTRWGGGAAVPRPGRRWRFWCPRSPGYREADPSRRSTRRRVWPELRALVGAFRPGRHGSPGSRRGPHGHVDTFTPGLAVPVAGRLAVIAPHDTEIWLGIGIARTQHVGEVETDAAPDFAFCAGWHPGPARAPSFCTSHPTDG